MKSIITLYCISILVVFKAKSQETSIAWESAVAVNYSINQWDLNSSLGHRTLGIERDETLSAKWAFIDLNQFISRRITPDFSVALGYKYRRIDPIDHEGVIEQRITQQLAFNHLSNRIRVMSRLRTEQRFFTNFFEHRYRYRASLDMPLSGLKIDINEFYALASNEILLASRDGDQRFDNRINLGLGYLASSFLRFQLDFTLRSENLNESAIQIPFITSSAILKL